MCYTAPGPRCGPHAKTSWDKSAAKLSNLNEKESKLSAKISAAALFEDEETLDSLRLEQQALRDRIDAQMDKVISDRNAYYATAAGVKFLQQKLEEEDNIKKIASLTRTYERAQQEYSQRLFAQRVLAYQKSNLESAKAGSLKELHESIGVLRAEETLANQRYARGCTENASQEMLSRLAIQAKEAKRKRISFEQRVSSLKSGQLGSLKSVKLSEVPENGKMYLGVPSSEFGIARSHFPQGAIVEIKSIDITSENPVVHLVTGDKKDVFADSVLFCSV